ncbi:hypothetical protein ACRALDRAFT_1077621 [Sodiomyces alcalophilus JCM 7366]|uniref:uncharacterized protein n=1 Tax=Sodiomyces alcalophilus JCM 7366 TaxID=591952 RepID=UPI0039B63B82
MNFEPYLVRTPQELKEASLRHGGLEVTHQLNSKEAHISASRWTRRHLIAYRLLNRREQAFLPVLRPGHDTVLGNNPRALYSGSEGELMRLPDGFFWVALSRAVRSEAPEAIRSHPQRHRSQVEHPGFMNSSLEIMGSSSPTIPSASEFGSDHSEPFGEDENDARRSKPEEVTVHLAISFLQLALHLILVQDENGQMEVRPRVERKMTLASTMDGALIAAEDDGGICLMRRVPNGWKEEHPFLALLEAKRSFRDIRFDDETNKGNPMISDETLAQYLGEAVITWRGRQDLLAHEVFLVAATSTFVRFIHFRFGTSYLEYLDAEDVATQQAIAEDPEKDTYVHMDSSEWFNLQSPEGRRNALCHILALLNWHEAHRSTSSQVVLE